MLPSTDARCGGSAEMCACFAGVWIEKSQYTRNVSVKQPVIANLNRLAKNGAVKAKLPIPLTNRAIEREAWC